ncbi:hypothetical protein [Oceanobacillus sojae]|uniref:hypothetical protein n=1 Tax=Oceanobacillus sojae TaxID=582851 RepID=UPI0009886668|nr:hypothetical protein [Oceanobacillus sojae]
MAELYVLAKVNEEGTVIGFPKGGGSSTAPRVKAYDSLASAKRGRSHHGGLIVKATGFEVVEEEECIDYIQQSYETGGV